MKKASPLPEMPLPGSLLHPVGYAISDDAIIHEGDRIPVGLSGGKDSLLLLHFHRCAPVYFEEGAVDGWPGTSDTILVTAPETGL